MSHCVSIKLSNGEHSRFTFTKKPDAKMIEDGKMKTGDKVKWQDLVSGRTRYGTLNY